MASITLLGYQKLPFAVAWSKFFRIRLQGALFLYLFAKLKTRIATAPFKKYKISNNMYLHLSDYPTLVERTCSVESILILFSQSKETLQVVLVVSNLMRDKDIVKEANKLFVITIKSFAVPNCKFSLNGLFLSFYV